MFDLFLIHQLHWQAVPASRREVERWIDEGRLKLNGELVKLGDRLKQGDYLQLNDRVVHWEKFSIQPTRGLL